MNAERDEGDEDGKRAREWQGDRAEPRRLKGLRFDLVTGEHGFWRDLAENCLAAVPTDGSGARGHTGGRGNPAGGHRSDPAEGQGTEVLRVVGTARLQVRSMCEARSAGLLRHVGCGVCEKARARGQVPG